MHYNMIVERVASSHGSEGFHSVGHVNDIQLQAMIFERGPAFLPDGKPMTIA
jgi:hypothetical protein